MRSSRPTVGRSGRTGMTLFLTEGALSRLELPTKFSPWFFIGFEIGVAMVKTSVGMIGLVTQISCNLLGFPPGLAPC